MVVERVSADVQAIAWSWKQAKLFIENSFAFSTDSIHVIAGVLIFLAAALLLRRPVSNWQPWLVVLVLTSINELADLWIESWPSLGRQYGQGAKDVLLTMLLPTLLLLTARSFPRLYAPTKPAGQAQAPD